MEIPGAIDERKRSTVRLLSILGVLIGLAALAAAQTAPKDWKIVKDEKGLCQIAVPPNWTVKSNIAFHENTPPDQASVDSNPLGIAPMPDRVQKTMHVDQMFENTDKRVLYSSSGYGGRKNFNASVPRSGGSCAVTVTFKPPISEDIAKTIALSLGPAK